MNIRTMVAAILFGTAPLLADAQEAIGQVALVTGSVTSGTGEQARALKAGDPIHEGQSITVAANSYASLKFADGGRVLLRPNSEFTVESFKYAGPAPVAPVAPVTPEAGTPAAPASVQGTAFFRLVRGGFRAISGLIGTVDRQSYRVTTPVATIGIRGTDYEVQMCSDDCPVPPQARAAGTLVAATELTGLELAQSEAGAGAAPGGGVIVATHEGSVEVKPPSGTVTFQVDAGQVLLALANGQSFVLPAVPDMMLIDPAPSPEACE
ncbi:MAG: FecR family protein [Nevskiaceae bacterium]